MKKVLAILTLSVAHAALGQSVLVDPRDGKTYGTMTIHGLEWMTQDLRFETSDSYCPNYDTIPETCEKTNFYSHQNLKDLCPEDWRLPTTHDWDVLITTFDREKTVKMLEGNKKFYRVDFLDQYNIFENNMLGLDSIGRTQGNERRYGDYVDYWTVNPNVKDSRFHIHVSSYTIVGHAHKHNVSEKNESRNRKFAVRCVCEQSTHE